MPPQPRDAHTIRSWLFVPGDSDRKFAKASASGADALICDLEDSVAEDAKPHARERVSAWLQSRPLAPDLGSAPTAPALWIRINALDGHHAAGDIAMAITARADGIVLPKAEGADDVARLAAMLDAGGAAQAMRIMPVATETPLAVLRLGSFATAPVKRLAAMTWGAEDLAAAIGAADNRDPESGRFHEPFRIVRAVTLFAAHAANVAAIDTLHADFRDPDGLRRNSEQSAREGFHGRLAIHPDQVAVINEAYTPNAGALAHARRIVAAFAEQPGVGVVGIDGKMVDRPHFEQAQRLIARARLFAG